MRTSIFIICFGVLGNPTFAQEEGANGPIKDFDALAEAAEGEISQMDWGQSTQATDFNPKQLGAAMTASEVAKEIAKFGYDPSSVIDLNNDGAVDDRFSLYKQEIALGIARLLVVPEQRSLPAFGYSPDQKTGEIVQAGLFGYFKTSPEEMREDLKEAIHLAVKDACEMPARPSQIRATASAVGVLELELTWISNDVCSRIE